MCGAREAMDWEGMGQGRSEEDPGSQVHRQYSNQQNSPFKDEKSPFAHMAKTQKVGNLHSYLLDEESLNFGLTL
jgi:hypothetical protein